MFFNLRKYKNKSMRMLITLFFDLGNDYNHDGGAGKGDNQMFLSDINQPVCCEDDGIKNSHKMAGRK